MVLRDPLESSGKCETSQDERLEFTPSGGIFQRIEQARVPEADENKNSKDGKKDLTTNTYLLSRWAREVF